MADLVTIFEIISMFGSVYFAVPVIAFLWLKKDKKLTLNFIFAFILTTLVAYGLKFIFQTQRPGVTEKVPFYNSAFPSGHASRAFLYSVFLSQKFEKFDRYFFFIFAILAAAGRVITGAHSVIDVIAGSIIGFAVSWLCIKYQGRILKFFKLSNIS